MKKPSTLLTFLLVFHFMAYSQDDIASVKKLTIEQLTLFQNHIEKLTTSDLSSEEKQQLIRRIQKLFALEGTIETMDFSRKKRKYPVKEYLERIANNFDSRVDIDITFLGEPEITSIEKTTRSSEIRTSTEYLVYGKLNQKYEKFFNGVLKYSDITVKLAKVKVFKVYDENVGKIFTKVLILEIFAIDIYENK